MGIKSFLHLFDLVWVYGCHNGHRNYRTICGFLPTPTVWVPHQSQFIRLGSKYFYLLSYLTDHVVFVFCCCFVFFFFLSGVLLCHPSWSNFWTQAMFPISLQSTGTVSVWYTHGLENSYVITPCMLFLFETDLATQLWLPSISWGLRI